MLAELILRWVMPLPFATGVGTTRTAKADIYGWASVPGRLERFANPDTGELSFYHINSRGWKDVEHELAKAPGVVRVLFLGDSYTAGIVPLEETYPRIVQGLFKKSGFPEVEIISMGVGGWGTDQELEALRREGVEYQPDFVVYQFSPNDLGNNLLPTETPSPQGIYAAKPFRYQFADGELVKVALSLKATPAWEGTKDRVKTLLMKSSLIYYFDKAVDKLRFQVRGIRSFYDPVDPLTTWWRHESVPQSEHRRRGWELLEALILEMKRVSEEHGAQFLIFPVDGDEGFRLWHLKNGFIQSDGVTDYSFSAGQRYPVDMKRPLKNRRAISERHGIALIEPKREYARYEEWPRTSWSSCWPGIGSLRW
jgi:hypothetical protein